MSVLATDKLGAKIAHQAALSRSTLFAGAGISARVDVPTWGKLLEELSGVCAEYGDDLSAKLINGKIAEEDYLGAASIYRLCGKIPVGERYKRLVTILTPPMTDQKLEKLRPLMTLGFGAVVTSVGCGKRPCGRDVVDERRLEKVNDSRAWIRWDGGVEFVSSGNPPRRSCSP